jgi:hypothetical protein
MAERANTTTDSAILHQMEPFTVGLPEACYSEYVGFVLVPDTGTGGVLITVQTVIP